MTLNCVFVALGFDMYRGLLVSVAMAVLLGQMPTAIADTQARISQFSGKPVPRFESLRYSTVNGRTGPTVGHPIAWRYERSGLPVLILKESPQWRWVRDPEGAEVWIHSRMLSSKTTAMARSDVTLQRAAGPDADEVAILQAGVIVEVVEEKLGWLKVRVGNTKGWAQSADFWGRSAQIDP